MNLPWNRGPLAIVGTLHLAGLLVAASDQSNTRPAAEDPANEFVQFVVQTEAVPWWTEGRGETDNISPKSFEIHGVVGRNRWTLESRMPGATNYYAFDGKNITGRRWARRERGKHPGGVWWTNTVASRDGNPGRKTGFNPVDEACRVAWLAFCSAPALNSPTPELHPPWEFWVHYVTEPLNREVLRFEDDLGLPRTVLLSQREQPVTDYRAYATTNIGGWTFPTSFFLLQYMPNATGRWALAEITRGEVVSISPAADPFPAAKDGAVAQKVGTRFTLVAPSKVKIDGTSNVHDWSLSSTSVTGFLELDNSVLAPASGKPGEKVEAFAEIFMPARHFQSGFSAPMFSEKADQAFLHKSLKTRENPNIVYRLLRLGRPEHGESGRAESGLVLESEGELVAAGITNTVSFPVRLLQEGGELKVSGTASAKLSDFHVAPPTAGSEGWAIEVGDDIQCSFELSFRDLLTQQSPGEGTKGPGD